MMRPRVHVLALGGTIAMTGPGGHHITPRLGAEELVRAVPGLTDVAEVTSEQLRQVPSTALTLTDLLVAARRVRSALDAGADGVVITQGTDTLEESAFALDLLLDPGAPVVVTGAMRSPDAAGPDGPANLLAAAQTAASHAAHGLGVLVVLDEQVHAASTVRKVRSFGPGAFVSPDTGPVGWVVEGRFHPRTVPAGVRTVPEPDEDRLAATVVGVLPVHLGDDPRAVVAAGGLGYAGLVVDAFGAGHVPPSFVEPLAELARTMPVVLASRTGGGPVHTETYAYPGSETELLAKGLLPAGWLDTRKARVLLTLLLAAGVPREEIGAWFTPAHDA